jgi:SAM-dependent methyltransferase
MALHDPRDPNIVRSLDAVDFGPGVGPEIERRLLGDVKGRRILDVGCGLGHTAVGLARRGARVIAVDNDVSHLGAARDLAADEAITIEFHQAQPAELAFLAADHVDLALAITSLSFVQDLDRVFRQVHRVVRPNGHFVLSVPHPVVLCGRPEAPVPWDTEDLIGDRFVHTAEAIVMALGRANFAVDSLFERRNTGALPETLVARARKLGV